MRKLFPPKISTRKAWSIILALGATIALQGQIIEIPVVDANSGRVNTADADIYGAVSNLNTGPIVNVGDNPSDKGLAYVMTFDMSDALGLIDEGARVTLELEPAEIEGSGAPADPEISLLGVGPAPASNADIYPLENGSTEETRVSIGTVPASADFAVYQYDATSALSSAGLSGENTHAFLIIRVRDEATAAALNGNGIADQLRFSKPGTRLIVEPIYDIQNDLSYSGRVVTAEGDALGDISNLNTGDSVNVGDNGGGRGLAYIMSFDLSSQLGAIEDGSMTSLTVKTNGLIADGVAPADPTVSFLGTGPAPTTNNEVYLYENDSTELTRVDLGTIPATVSSPDGIEEFTFDTTTALSEATLDSTNSYAFFIIRVRDAIVGSDSVAEQTRFDRLASKISVDQANYATFSTDYSGRVGTAASDPLGPVSNLNTGDSVNVGDNPSDMGLAFIITFDASNIAGDIDSGNPVMLTLATNGLNADGGPAPADLVVDFLGNGPAPTSGSDVYPYENDSTVESRVTLGTIPAGTVARTFYFNSTEALSGLDLSGGNDHLFYIVRVRDETAIGNNAVAEQTRMDRLATKLQAFGGSSTVIPTTFTVETQTFADGTPFGYQDLSNDNPVVDEEVIDLSARPFIDYLIPNNSVSAGAYSEKASGGFLSAENQDYTSFGGANSGDDFQVVFDWSDGDPVASEDNFYGVSWGNFSGTSTITFETRVDLVQMGEVTIYHWWNDGWDYSTGDLDGHTITIERYNASDELIDTASNLFDGGDGSFATFYTTVIDINLEAEGEYLIIRNHGHNLGYKGTAVAGPLLANNFSVESTRLTESNLPYGYQDLSGETIEIDPLLSVNLSAAPFLDYLVPNNSVTPGIYTEKSESDFIASSTVANLGGGANSGDDFQVVFNWEDGDPNATGTDFYGVSWGNWSGSSTAVLDTRIDLLQDGELTIFHWWNDGWNYGAGDVLPGHELTVSHYDSAGILVDQYSSILPSGFYSTAIDISRQNEGDYVIITNEGHNIGYKGTAVAGPIFGSIVSLATQTFEDGNTPAGYQNFGGDEANIDDSLVVNVSSTDFVDYLIPKRGGSPGVRAAKITGEFITETSVDSFSGGTKQGDAWQVVFEWSDGTPTLEFSPFYGVSWTCCNNTTQETWETRIDLVTAEPVTVYHWWNDGWDYSDPSVLFGHVVSVSMYNSSDELIDYAEETYPGGNFPTFYSSIIDVTRENEGDYIIITNTGHNIGYKGTAVSADVTFAEIVGATLDAGVYTSAWFGDFEMVGDFAYHYDLGWLYAGEVYTSGHVWLWSEALGQWLYTNESIFPFAYGEAADDWFYVGVGEGIVYDFSQMDWL